MPPIAVNARQIAAFAAIYLLWGSTYLAVAIAVHAIPPFLMMGARSVVAGLVLLGIMHWRDRLRATGWDWWNAAVSGLLLFVDCHGVLAWAQQSVPSGLAAVLLATIPFWMALIRYFQSGTSHQNSWTLFALVPGLGGVALIAWKGGAGSPSVDPTMVLLILASAFSWAAGSLLSQGHSETSPAIASAGMQLLCGGVVLLAISAACGEPQAFSFGSVTAEAWASLAWLIVAGSLVAFTSYVWLLDHAPAPLVATYTFINPVIAVFLGWAILGEQLTPRTLTGIGVVIGSVILAWRLQHGTQAFPFASLQHRPGSQRQPG